MKIDLPEGATVGRIVLVTYPELGLDTVVPGRFEGRIMKVDGPRITVHFEYGDCVPPRETLVLNLETGMDEDYGVPITDVVLKLVQPSKIELDPFTQ